MIYPPSEPRHGRAIGRSRSAPIEIAPPGLRLDCEIGRGSGTTVYRASRDGTRYVVKIVDRVQADTVQVLTRFRRQAGLLAGIAHPRVPAVHDVGLIQGRPYLVTDFFDGHSLADLLSDGRLDPPRAVKLCLDILGPIARMHQAGVIHRDLKPDNIVLLGDGSPALIDFGLAVHEATELRELRSTPLAVGTLAYTPPEQAGTLGRPVDRRSDLYSLGVVLFECLTGTSPFTKVEAGEMLRSHAMEAAPDVRSLVPVGPGLAAIVARLLAKDPDDRYEDAETLLAHLMAVNDDVDIDLVVCAGECQHSTRLVPATSTGSTLCGRDAELATLAGYWERVRSGAGTTCVITGDAGSGATRLAAETSQLVREDGATVLHLDCRDDDPRPFGPIRAAIDRWLGEIDTLPSAQQETEHRRIRAAAAGSSLPAHVSSRLSEVLGGGGSIEPGGQDGFASAAAAFIAELARSGPGTLLVIDNAPLLDVASQRVMTRLIDHLWRTPLLITSCIGRDDWESAGRSAALAWTTDRVDGVIELHPLNAEGVADLITTHLPGVEVGSELIQFFTDRGRGNALITLQYLRAAVDAGLLSPSWGRWTLDADGLNDLELPADARELVTARLDRLDVEDLELLTVAVVIGGSIDPAVLAEVAGTDLARATSAMAFAASEGLLATDPGRRDGARYRLLHAQMRRTLLERVDEGERRRLHWRAAQALERQQTFSAQSVEDSVEAVFAIASHYLAADPDWVGGQAHAVWRAAGRLALEGHAPTEAATYLEAAASSGPVDADLLVMLGTAYIRDGRFEDAHQRLEVALATEREPTRRAKIHLLMSEVERDRWNTAEAWLTAREGLGELRCSMPTTGTRQAVGSAGRLVLGGLLVLCGRLGRVGGSTRSRAAVLAELHRTAGYLAIINGQPQLQVLHTIYALPTLARLGHGPEWALGVGSLGVVCQMLGRRRLSSFFLKAADDAAAQIDNPQLAATLAWYRASSAYQSGADDGESWQQVVDQHSQWYPAGQVCDAVATFVWDSAALGRSAEARSWYERTHRLVPRSDRTSTPLPISSAVVMTAEGRPAEAVAALERVAEEGDGPPPRMHAILLMARLHALVEQGDFGPPFDEVVDNFAAVGPRPTQMIRQFRIFLIHLAFGRLAQWRVALEHGDTTAVAAKRAAARRAVHDVARTAVVATELIAAQLTRADLELLEGHPERAWRLLEHIRPARRSAPVLDFELARTAARTLASMGLPEPARVRARFAMLVASEAGLVRRARAVAREFGISSSNGSLSPEPSRWTSSTASATIDKRRLEALQEISLVASTVIDRNELARLCLDRTLRILSAERAMLFLMSEDGSDQGRLLPYLGRDDAGRDVATLTGYSASLVERVHTTCELVVVTGTDEGAALGAQSVVLHDLRSIMVAPLQLDGRMLGVVYLDSRVAKGIFTEGDAGILTALTTHIATALETARAAELEVSLRTVQRQRDLAEALRINMEHVAGVLNPDEVLERLTAAIPVVLPGVRSFVLLPGDSELNDEELHAVVERRQPVNGRERTPRALRDRVPAGAAWSLRPLVTTNRIIGLLVLHGHDPKALSPAELDLASVLIGQALTAHERAELFSKVQELALVDELTGVANRRRFFEVASRDLASARRQGRPTYAMMIDVDRFKRVNDEYGHAVGDEVIHTVAQRLQRETRENDVVGRYGGEEFAVVACHAAAGAEFAERLRKAIADTPVRTSVGPLHITVSIGVAASWSQDADIGEVLARADAALYRAKKGGRDRIVIGERFAT